MRCSTAEESDPGTSKPPPVRFSVCFAASGSVTTRITSQTPPTAQRCLPTKSESVLAAARIRRSYAKRTVASVTCARSAVGQQIARNAVGDPGRRFEVVARVAQHLHRGAVARGEEIREDSIGAEPQRDHALRLRALEDL